MNWCDPCAANPLSPAELRELGVFWVDEPGTPLPGTQPRRAPTQARDVFVTRLHVRYDAQSFPEDLGFRITGDRSNFQGRYVLRHAWEGASSCAAADEYRRNLPARREAEATTLASLTGWDLAEIRERLGLDGPAPGPEPWWSELWN